MSSINNNDISDPYTKTHLLHFTSNKAGMENLDRNKINQIIMESSKDSAYFKNEEKRTELNESKIKNLKSLLKNIDRNELNALQLKGTKYIEKIQKDRNFNRLWIVVDMDMFYAAVEMRENPKLIGKPIAVGGMNMISTANYEARKFGVRSAMPGFIALKLCPELIFVNHSFSKYEEVAAQTREIFQLYDPEFEAMSLDEAYLDVTNYLASHESTSAVEVAQEIRDKIFEVTRLTASAGISCNRMLAKMCSDVNKPNGQYYLEGNIDKILTFLDSQSVRKIPGVGRMTEATLRSFDINNISDIRKHAGIIYKVFTPATINFLLACSVGESGSEHEESSVPASRKSISCDRTFSSITSYSEVMKKLLYISENIAEQLKAKNISIKIKLSSFMVKQKSITLPFYINDSNDIFKHSCSLFKSCFSENEVEDDKYPSMRLLGIRVATFDKNQFEKVASSQKLIDTFVASNTSIASKVFNENSDDLLVSGELINLIEDDEIIIDNKDFNEFAIEVDDIICVDQTQVSEYIICDSCNQNLNTLSLNDKQINEHIKLCKRYSSKSLIEIEDEDLECIDVTYTPTIDKSERVLKENNLNINTDPKVNSKDNTKLNKKQKPNKINKDAPITGNKVTSYFTKLNNKPKK